MTDWREVQVKVCSKCGQHHYGQGIAYNFSKDRSAKDGFQSRCKRCQKKHGKKYRDTEAAREVRARYRGSEEYKAAERERVARYRASEQGRAFLVRNSEKAWARTVLGTAIRYGKIERPDKCEACGENPGTAHGGRSLIEAHHHDYLLPLDVTFLCKSCHVEADKELAA